MVSVSKFQTLSTGIASVSGMALSKVFGVVRLADRKLPLPNLVCAGSSNYVLDFKMKRPVSKNEHRT